MRSAIASQIIGTGLCGGGALLSGGGNIVQANATNGGFTGSYALQETICEAPEWGITKVRMNLVGMLLLFGAAVVSVGNAHSQATRYNKTWIASYGNDTSADCSRANPCRRLDTAVNRTTVGGVVTCIDSAAYGALTFFGSIEVNCLDATAIVAPTVGSGVTNMGIEVDAGAKVILRGFEMSFNQQQGNNLSIIGSGTVILDNFRIASAGQTGILYQPSGSGKLVVQDSLIVNNGSGEVGAGIRVVPTPGGSAQVLLDRLTVSGNVFGIAFDGSRSAVGINATIRDSTMSSNSQDGVVATSSASTAPIAVSVINSTLVNNTYGIRSIGSNVTVRMQGSQIIGNGVGLSGGGALLSGGGNTVQANATNGGFTGSYALQ